MPPKNKDDERTNFVLLHIVRQLAYIRQDLSKLETQMAANTDEFNEKLTALEAIVSEDLTVDRSAESLLDGLKQMLDDAIAAGGNLAQFKARIEAISSAIGNSTGDLKAAVVRNTVAETEPPPEPPTP